jgi:hypothetical protein
MTTIGASRLIEDIAREQAHLLVTISLSKIAELLIGEGFEGSGIKHALARERTRDEWHIRPRGFCPNPLGRRQQRIYSSSESRDRLLLELVQLKGK